MPQFSVTYIALFVAALIVGIVAGWIFRGSRADSEKEIVRQGWQEQLESHRQELQRLIEQNKDLMQQNGQYQASRKDAELRAREFSAALKEAFGHREKLQRQIRDIRNNLESTVAERDHLQTEIKTRGEKDAVEPDALERRDRQIATLTRDLRAWRQRIPPLIEKFRTRNEEAEELERDLAMARARIQALEAIPGSDQTRVEPVDPDTLGEDLDASNDSDDDIVVAALDETVQPDRYNEKRRDNLKRIKGVGPAIEKTLNEIGICRLQQVAEMSEYDIDRVAQRLKGFRSRIYREDWIGQARDLLDQKISGSA